MDFNPRSRTGSDRSCASLTTCSRNFNPRSRTGSDPKRYVPRGALSRFQSTLPHRERHPRTEIEITPLYFNPRSRTGSDLIKCKMFFPSFSFQSTLPHRERRAYAAILRAKNDFNPRSRTGSDTRNTANSSHTLISIHAPAQGATGYI